MSGRGPVRIQLVRFHRYMYMYLHIYTYTYIYIYLEGTQEGGHTHLPGRYESTPPNTFVNSKILAVLIAPVPPPLCVCIRCTQFGLLLGRAIRITLRNKVRPFDPWLVHSRNKIDRLAHWSSDWEWDWFILCFMSPHSFTLWLSFDRSRWWSRPSCRASSRCCWAPSTGTITMTVR